MKVVIAGGGATGCFAALLLARAGHEVVVLDRDRLEPRRDVDDAAVATFRATAPQLVHPHLVMARCRELVSRQLPDVYAELMGAGVVEAPLPTQMPPSLPDKDPRPGDERLVQLMTRRSTFDLVLGRAVRAEPGVAVRTGARVAGLLAEPGARRGEPPRVTGVRTVGGTGEGTTRSRPRSTPRGWRSCGITCSAIPPRGPRPPRPAGSPTTRCARARRSTRSSSGRSGR